MGGSVLAHDRAGGDLHPTVKLAPGRVTGVVLFVNVAAAPGAVVTNTANLTPIGTNPANDTATVKTTVVGRPVR